LRLSCGVHFSRKIWGEFGVGGTLTGNAFSVAVLRATLERVATLEAFEHMLGGGR